MKRACWLAAVMVALATSGVGLAAEDKEAQQAIAALRAEIGRHDELYHRQAAPEISDAEYDALKRRLAELERAHPVAARLAPPLGEVGDDRSGLFATVRHGERMLSLEKAYAETDLRAFDARVRKATGAREVEYFVEPKYDGLAISVVYARGRFVRAVTRGDGTDGDDVSANVREIAEVPRELKAGAPWPEWMEVRGEIHVPWAAFQRVNAEREAAGEVGFATPRTLAAGTLRQLDPELVGARGLGVVFFGVGTWVPETARPATHSELRERLAAWGLPVAEHGVRVRGGDALARAIRELERARDAWEFPTDGVVIKVNEQTLQRELGASESAPRWALAYKFATERAETQVRAITIQVGRTGVLTPVAELVPVVLGGSTVARATLHNREEIARRDVRVGDFVYVEKAGEIIPAVVGVNRARRPAEARVFAFPPECPGCGGAVTMRAGEVAVRCGNAACGAQVRRRIEHYASKAGVDIEGLGPTMIEAIVARGWVQSVADLYRLRREDLLTLGKNNGKSVDQLLAAIERSKGAELWRVMHGLGIPGIGVVAARQAARQHGSLEAWAAAEPRARELAQALVAAGVRPVDAERAGEGRLVREGALAGTTVVLTGTLPTLTRAQATALIEAAGGKVTGSVGRTTSFVVAGAEAGAKLEQARKLGVVVIEEGELRRMVGER